MLKRLHWRLLGVKIRKFIIGSIVVCLLIQFSQNSVYAELGIKGGASVSGLFSATGDFRHFLGYEIDWLSMGNLVGFQIGVFYTFNVSSHFKFQPEIHFATRGGDASEVFVFDNIEYKVKLYYLEIPLLLKYEIPLEGRFRPGIFLGPYAAFKLSAKKHTEIWGRKETADLTNVQSFDYGAVIGGGVEYDLGPGRLILELRYNLGLKNILTMPEGFIRLYEDKDSVRNFALLIMTGYKF